MDGIRWWMVGDVSNEVAGDEASRDSDLMPCGTVTCGTLGRSDRHFVHVIQCFRRRFSKL